MEDEDVRRSRNKLQQIYFNDGNDYMQVAFEYFHIHLASEYTIPSQPSRSQNVSQLLHNGNCIHILSIASSV